MRTVEGCVVRKPEDLIWEFVGEDFVSNEAALQLARRALDLTNIVNPPAERFAECWCAIYTQVCKFDFDAADRREAAPPGQQTKDAARRIADALERARNAARDLDPTIEAWSVQQTLHSADIQRVLTWCYEVAEGPVRPPYRTDGALKREAAKHAFQILARFGRSTATTKGSLFRKLAAAFYGDAEADLDHQCREVKKQMRVKGFAA
jgi:hypothetical protein